MVFCSRQILDFSESTVLTDAFDGRSQLLVAKSAFPRETRKPDWLESLSENLLTVRSPFPPTLDFLERSSPSRVRFAAQPSAPLTAPGRSSNPSHKSGKAQSRQRSEFTFSDGIRKRPLIINLTPQGGIHTNLPLLQHPLADPDKFRMLLQMESTSRVVSRIASAMRSRICRILAGCHPRGFRQASSVPLPLAIVSNH